MKRQSGDAVRAKIRRAEVHLHELRHLVVDFDWSKPYKVKVEVEPPPPHQDRPPQGRVAKQHRIVVAKATLVPTEIGLVAGDVLTNLRASLDHLAWDLVLAAAGKPTRRTSFPILEKQPPKPPTVEGGVSAPALKLIEKMQPYNRPEGVGPSHDRLWILNELVNIDKHRHLLLTATAYDTIRVRIAGASWQNQPTEPVPLKPGVNLGGVAGASRKDDIECELSITVSLADGEPGGGSALTTLLERLILRVRDEVVPAFDGMR